MNRSTAGESTREAGPGAHWQAAGESHEARCHCPDWLHERPGRVAAEIISDTASGIAQVHRGRGRMASGPVIAVIRRGTGVHVATGWSNPGKPLRRGVSIIHEEPDRLGSTPVGEPRPAGLRVVLSCGGRTRRNGGDAVPAYDGSRPSDAGAGDAVECRGRKGQEHGRQQLRPTRRSQRPGGPSDPDHPRQPERDTRPIGRDRQGPDELGAAPDGARGAHRAFQVRFCHRPQLAPVHPENSRATRRGRTGRGIREGRSHDSPDPGNGAGLPGAAHRLLAPVDGTGHAHAGRKRRRHPVAYPGRSAEQACVHAAAALQADTAAFRGDHAHGSGRPGHPGHRSSERGLPAE